MVPLEMLIDLFIRYRYKSLIEYFFLFQKIRKTYSLNKWFKYFKNLIFNQTSKILFKK